MAEETKFGRITFGLVFAALTVIIMIIVEAVMFAQIGAVLYPDVIIRDITFAQRCVIFQIELLPVLSISIGSLLILTPIGYLFGRSLDIESTDDKPIPVRIVDEE